MAQEERIIIKNFGPITEASIIIKPFMVFIGESGSGKSVVLKLLSLLRWIAKKNHYGEFAKTLGIKESYRVRIERALKDSGLEEFINHSTYIEYVGETEKIIIQKENNTKLTINSAKRKEIFLEKISFITDDRFAVALLLNNQIRGLKSSLPYHLEKTYEDFEDSFQNLSEAKKLNIKTMDFKILREKYGAVEQRYFLKNQEVKIQLHNSSSGMKSISIIEPILTYFSTAYDKEEVLNRFLIDMYVKGNFKDPDEFLKKIRSLEELEENECFRLNFFIEEPELSLFPNAQKKLIDFFSEVFNKTQNINIAFSTHSPYMLSSLNCLLKAYELNNQKPKLQKEIEKIVPKQYWLSLDKFVAYKFKNGKIIDIIDKDTKLILADEIDEVSEEIGSIFDTLLDLEFE